MKIVRVLAVLAVLAAPTACAARRGGVTYHDPTMDFSLIQNVAVMPFTNLTPHPSAGDRVRDVFMTMLQATGSVYVLPPGEVGRGISRAGLSSAAAPTAEEVVAFAKLVKADVVLTGTVREYGEVRAASASSNVISISLRMMEAQTGKVVWSASATEGGVTAAGRLFGTGGEPMDEVTEKAVETLIDRLFE